MTEREAYIALNMMEKVGPVVVRSLATHLGSAAAVFTAEAGALTGARGVGRELAEAILAQRGQIDPAAEIERAEKAGTRILTPLDAEYPKPLAEIHDPPLALYVRGTLESRDRHAIALVGTRHPTVYGRACAERLAGQLARAGFTVVSGLAQGIDTAAHEGCLKAQGRTLAVMGCGPDRVYPPENRELAKRVAEGGAVLSEFPFGRQPDRTTFAIRNRIISGLSMGVVVVEAGLQSGALITVRAAAEQGRTVFAVPGRIDTPTAKGPHSLLKDGARLVEDVEDILKEFEFLFPRANRGAAADPEAAPRPTLSPAEQALVQQLEQGCEDVDGLIRAAAMAPAAVNAALIGLEMKKVVRMLPGRRLALLR